MKKSVTGIAVGILVGGLLLNSVVAKSKKEIIDIHLNSINLEVDHEGLEVDNILYRDTTYVPIRAVAEALGKDVGWDQKSRLASITDRTGHEDLEDETVEGYKFGEEDLTFRNLKIGETNMESLGSMPNTEYGRLIRNYETYDIATDLITQVWSYENAELEFFESYYGDYIFNGYELINDKYEGPRGMRVGDDLESILKHFPNDGNAIDNQGVQRLYGDEYDHHADIYYGEDGKVGSIEFIHYECTSFGYYMSLQMNNDKLIKINVHMH